MNASGAIARARARVRDQNNEFFTTDSGAVMYMINGTLEEIYSTLQFSESQLIYGHTLVSTTTGTTASTCEVSLGFKHAGFLDNGVYRMGYGESPLFAVTELDKRHFNVDGQSAGRATTTGPLAVTGLPTAYYLTEQGDTSASTMGFLHIPDNIYTFNVFYWKPITQVTAVTDPLPYNGIFNEYITHKLVVEMLEVMERDNSRAAIYAQLSFNKAMQRVYSRGLKERKSISNMFAVEGI
jgi:hypothetical protein